MKSKKVIFIVITVIFAMNLTACFKSQGRQNGAGGSTGSGDGNSIIGGDKGEYRGKNDIIVREAKDDTNGRKDLKIIITDIPYDDGYSLYFAIYDTENYGKDVSPLADAYGEIENGSVCLEPHIFLLSKMSWKRPGEYYIRLGFSFDNVFHFYTDGYTLQELGINGFPETDEDYRKMPTCILGPGENFISFSQQVLRIERGK